MADESPHGSSNEAERQRLYAALPDLGPRALAILADIAERLQRGAKQYGGDFDDKPRDWDQETFEELADGLVYSTMRLMQLRERRAADEARQRAAVRAWSAGHDPADILCGCSGGCSACVARNRAAVRVYDAHQPGPYLAKACPCTICKPGPREDWEKTRDGCG